MGQVSPPHYTAHARMTEVRSDHTPPSPQPKPGHEIEAERSTAVKQPSGEDVGHSAPKAVRSEATVRVRNHLNHAVKVQPIRRFADVAEDLPLWLNEGIAKMGHTVPTTVQSFAIPLLMEDKDIVGIAPTGSGKTVAFAIPALATVDLSQRRRSGKAEPTVLVLGPTRELVQQTKNVFVTLGGGRAVTRAAFGGEDRDKQRMHLTQGCEALIATPGRLCDFIDSGDVSLEKVQFFVLDEADRMLEMGFGAQLRHIVSKLPPRERQKRRVMMWSATWCSQVESLAKGMLSPTERLTVEVDREHKTNVNIEQRAYGLQDHSDRLAALVKLFTDGTVTPSHKTIIFANHKETTETLADNLLTALQVANREVIQALHGGMKQARRDAIMRKFRSSDIRVLVATDVAARGLDVPDVEHVVNYDLPADTDRYVHRIGRTGRAGRKGISHTFLCRGDGSLASDLADFMESNGAKLDDDVLSVVRHCRAGDVRRYERFSKVAVTSTVRFEADDEDCPAWKSGVARLASHHVGSRGGRSRGTRVYTNSRNPSPSPQ